MTPDHTPDHTASLLVHQHGKIPHMCKTLWQGEMFAVAVATWCNLTGDPGQTRHWGIPPLADATVSCTASGRLGGTTIIQQGSDMWWKERTVVFCFSVNMQRVGPAGQDRLTWFSPKCKFIVNMGIFAVI